MTVEQPVAPVVREQALEFGPVIGSLLDRKLWAWVRAADGVYDYEGVAPGPKPGYVDQTQVPPDCIVMAPGVCYRKRVS